MKRKTQVLIIAFASVLLGIAFFILNDILPKYSLLVPQLIVFGLIDLYIWHAVCVKVRKRSPIWKYVIISVYWLPLLFSVFYFLVLFFLPFSSILSPGFVIIQGVIISVYVSKMLPVVLLIFADIMRLYKLIVFQMQKKSAVKSAEKKNTISRARFIENLALASGGIAFGGMLLGMVRWAFDFQVKKESVYIPGLSSGFNGLRIIHISDIHFGSWTDRKTFREAVDIINSYNADLIFFTGDLVNFYTDEALSFETELSRMHAKLGIFAVLGNHDYGDYLSWDTASEKEANMEKLFALYRRLEWTLLNNENRIINISGNKLAVIGVENWSVYDRFPKLGDLDKAMKGCEDAGLRLLLSHDPTHWEEKVVKADYPVDISFSGHTHGFQFGVETKNFRWSPAKYMYKHWAGLYSTKTSPKGKKYLYVNRGLGSIGYPGRIGILPEITVMEIYSE